MDQKSYIVGIDIGGTNIRIGLIDAEMNLLNFSKIPQESVLRGDSLTRLATFIKQYLKENAGDKNIKALAMGLPAAMDKERAIVLNAPNIHGFDGINVKNFLQYQFEFPVYLEKDVTMLFYYDLHHNKISDEGVIIACYIGTGFGNVISVDGKLIVGNDGAACELGHIPAWDKSDICACGNKGCVETYAAGKYLQHLQENHFPDIQINEMFEKKADTPEVEEYLKHLAIPIATEINIINPSKIILGGGVLSMRAFPREKLEKHLKYYSRKPFPANNLNFIYSEDSGENGVIGGAIYARIKLKQEGN